MLIVARTLTLGVLVSVLSARVRHGSAKVCYCAANPIAVWSLRTLSRLLARLELVELPNPPPQFSAALIKDEDGLNSRSRVQLSVVRMLEEIAKARTSGGLPAVEGWLSGHESGPLQMHLSLQAAKQLLEYAFLGQFALSHSATASAGANGEAIVLVPKKWWRRFVVDWYATSPVSVGSPAFPDVPFERLVVRARERYRKHANSVGEVEPVEWFQPEFLSLFPKCASDDRPGQATRVGVLLLDSIDPRRRCNAPWYWSTDFRRNDVVFLIWDQITSGRIDQEVINSVRANGSIVYRQGARTAKAHPDVPQWQASTYCRLRFVVGRLGAIINRLSLHDLFEPGFLWHLSGTVRLIVNSSWWYDFFKRNEIGVFVEVELDTDATTRAFAMKALGGMVIAAHRSMEYDHFQFRAERCADLFLYSGVHDLRQTVDISNKKTVVLTGFPVIDNGAVPTPLHGRPAKSIQHGASSRYLCG